MRSDTEMNNKIEVALSSINNIEPASPSPYFYNKVLAKINNTKDAVWEKWSGFFLRPAITFSIVCLIIIVNAFVVFSRAGINSHDADETEVAISDEYNVSVTALYYLENEKP